MDRLTSTDTPAFAYFNSLWATPLNWAFNTIPQGNAKDREMFWPRGKVLGGSSAINGMYFNRPAKTDLDSWQNLVKDLDNAEDWNWEAFWAAMKKSENFSPPQDAMAAQGACAFDAASHGDQGPIHASYPGYTVPWNKDWNEGLVNMGVPRAQDTYGGENAGTYISLTSLNPNTWKRSYSRSGYLDAIAPRDNYDVLANAHVTRMIFDEKSDKKNLTASAVEFSMDGGASKRTVKVKKEVILSGGTVGSPSVLMHSGIGPKDVLTAAGVDIISELPGVGNHLQDHLLSTIYFDTTGKTPAAIWMDEEDTTKNDTLYLSFVNDAVAYIDGQHLFANGLADFTKSTTSAQYTPPSTAKSVLAGYSAITTTTSTTLSTTLGQIELLLVTSALDGTVGITAALQHPYSHGAITIASADPFAAPLINPNYLSHPSDVTLLREGLKLARQLANTAPFSDTLTGEVTPGTDKVSSDADWEDWLRGHSDTEYHPSSTCAMLPLDKGGVVDASLKVYGLANVRVADASVPPVAFSAHLVGSTYGVAERAAEIIRRDWNVPKPVKQAAKAQDDDNSGSKKPEESSTTSSASSEASGDAKDNAARNVRPVFVGVVMAAVAVVMSLV